MSRSSERWRGAGWERWRNRNDCVTRFESGRRTRELKLLVSYWDNTSSASARKQMKREKKNCKNIMGMVQYLSIKDSSAVFWQVTTPRLIDYIRVSQTVVCEGTAGVCELLKKKLIQNQIIKMSNQK